MIKCKWILLSPCLLFFVASIFTMEGFAQRTAKDIGVSHSVMTFNVRNSNASIKDGVNGWPNRKDWIKEMLYFYRPGIIGMQEVLHDQIIDLQKMLPNYEYVGIGRNNGKTEGEYSPIFYNTVQYELLQGATFWLSEDPDKPSVSWGAATYRIVTWAEFRDKASGEKFFLFNSHFDNREIARNKSAKLIVEKVHEIAGKSPAIIMGDFNSNPKTQAYLNLTDKSDEKNGFFDSKLYAESSYGPEGTFHGFGRVPVDKQERIDFIFTNQEAKVEQYLSISEQRGEVFLSDHLPILARIQF